MKCLQRYTWVKLPRSALPTGKGILGAWMKLASRAAFRKGLASYCGYENPVEPGMWAGGVVGLKSILGVRSRAKALETLEKLAQLGYLAYELDKETKKLTYQITDWVVKCSGKECSDGAVYTTDGYAFLCLPRNITERLAQQHYTFEEADAWLDLWCHTVWEDSDNGFSFLAPTIQYGKYGANLTLETLGQRWGWEKTKVWRFLKKHGDAFSLYRLPGSYGCLIFNESYPSGTEVSLPAQGEVVRIFEEIRFLGANTHKGNVGQSRFGKLVAWFSRKLRFPGRAARSKNRVAVSDPIIRAYISSPKSWKNCLYDCKYFSWAVLFLITVWQLFRVFGGPITEAENPLTLIARSSLFAVLIAYAKPIFLITLDIARAPYTALLDITMTGEDFTFAGVEQTLSNGPASFVAITSVVGTLLILLIALGWNYFKLLLETVERYVVVGVLCYTSPLAYPMGASKATSQVFKSWCRMVGSQLLLLTMNVWFLRGFSTSVGQFIGNGGALSNGNGSIFLWLFCALAFLKTAQRFDSYLASLGLNVAQTGSSMGMEMLMAARVLSGATSGAKDGARGIEKSNRCISKLGGKSKG